jgi:hypothetical protein
MDTDVIGWLNTPLNYDDTIRSIGREIDVNLKLRTMFRTPRFGGRMSLYEAYRMSCKIDTGIVYLPMNIYSARALACILRTECKTFNMIYNVPQHIYQQSYYIDPPRKKC